MQSIRASTSLCNSLAMSSWCNGRVVENIRLGASFRKEKSCILRESTLYLCTTDFVLV
uniref:Uncharacterized protein n=1 Tax=Oryza brachyantha TaxID=4533 RepID=J3N843_ORYBR